MSERLEFAEHEAKFWEDRYRVQHKTVHKLEDALAAERQHRERLEEDLRFIYEELRLVSIGETGKPMEMPDKDQRAIVAACARARAALFQRTGTEE